MSRNSSFRQTIKISALIFGATALCLLLLGAYRVLQWSDSVRAAYQAMAASRSSSVPQPQKSESKEIQSTESNAEQTPASSSSPPDSAQAFSSTASTLLETTTTTLPFYEELARTPLIPTCALITQILNSRHVKRLKEEKARGLSEHAGHLKSLFRLTASAAFMEFMARLPHNYALMYSYSKDPNFFTRLEYAAEILLAKKELEQNLERVREIENRSYRTYFVAATLIDNPDLIGDSNFNTACESLADMSKPMNTAEANAYVLEMFQQAQVNPEETKFDPNWISQTTIQTNDEGYSYYGGKNSILEELKRLKPAPVAH